MEPTLGRPLPPEQHREKMTRTPAAVLLQESLRLMRVDRPVGSWLLLWPSLWSLTAAQNGRPGWVLLLVFTAGAFIMRSAGCVANDLADRRIDPLVARTRDRPLAAGRISVGWALALLLVLLLAALVLALQLNPLALKLCFGGAFLAVSYPFTKRFIHLPQFYLGAAFGWGVIIAWAAAAGGLTLEAWLLFAATLTWAAGYDTIYAMMDREDDLKIGVKSTAILFGRYDIAAVFALYLVTLLLLAVAGWRLGYSPFFYLFLGVALGHMIWQVRAVRGYQPKTVLRVFLSNQWLGLIVLAGFFLG